MNRFVLNLALVASVFALPMIVGCDHTVSESSKVETKSDGSTVSDKEKTSRTADGMTKTTTEHQVTK